MQLGPVICIRLADLSYKKKMEHRRRQRRLLIHPIKRIKSRSRPSVSTTGHFSRMECASPSHRTTTPTTAAYESGQQPSSVPLPFRSTYDCIQHYDTSDPLRWQSTACYLLQFLDCLLTCLLAHSGRIDSVWHLCCARQLREFANRVNSTSR